MPEVSCENSHLTFKQLAKGLITETATGDKAIRIMIVDACAEDAITCEQSHIDLDTLLKGTIGVAPCGKIALRLGIKPEALANAVGAVSYADLTAANTALAAGVIFFNVALGKLDITTA